MFRMKYFTHAMVLLVLALLLSAVRVNAAPAAQTGGLSAAEADAMLDAHNSWRQRYSVPPVVWDAAVAAVAQDWANQMAATDNFSHRPNNAFGENIWAGSSGFFVVTDPVNSWGSEVADYDFATNTCAPGKKCGHFTQIVWARTTKIGCGRATGNGNDYFVCNYDPPGNFVGQTPGASPAAAVATLQPTATLAATDALTATTAAQTPTTGAPLVPATAIPAQRGTANLNVADANALLDAHNAVRAKYHVPLLNWDDTVAAFAQGWADQIAAAGGTFSVPAGNHYGVNFYFASTGSAPAGGVAWWEQAASDFDLNTNTCADGKNCRAFTQLVWADSTKLGCGKATANGNDYYICNYDPAGNVAGQTTGASLVAQKVAPTATATATATISATALVTQTATVSATLTPTLTITATAPVTATAELTATLAATETIAATLTPTPTATPTLTSADKVTTTNTVTPTRALTVTTGLSDAEADAMLEAHNSWRQRYSVPPLVWDASAAALAQDWANQMAATNDFRHRPDNALGENIWAGSTGFFVPSDAVNSWGSEVEHYDLIANTCAVGQVCGHFTQLVWARTTKVGCGKATGFGNDYYVCNYDPAGNVAGETPGAAPVTALATVQPTDAPTPTPQPGANLPANTDPFTAIPFNSPNQVVPGGGALWYTVPVNGGDVTLRIPQGADRALGFWVFAPTLTTGPSDGTHIGTGNVEGSDLVWTGSALEPGTYFMVVFNNTTEPAPFTISVQ